MHHDQRKKLSPQLQRALQCRDGILRAEVTLHKAMSRRANYLRGYKQAIKRLAETDLLTLKAIVRDESIAHTSDEYLEMRLHPDV